MNYFFLFLFYIITLTQIESYKPRLCIDCIYSIPNVVGPEFSRCKKFPVQREDTSFLVTGIRTFPETDYMFCSTVRSTIFLCGPYALSYSKKSNHT